MHAHTFILLISHARNTFVCSRFTHEYKQVDFMRYVTNDILVINPRTSVVRLDILDMPNPIENLRLVCECVMHTNTQTYFTLCAFSQSFQVKAALGVSVTDCMTIPSLVTTTRSSILHTPTVGVCSILLLVVVDSFDHRTLHVFLQSVEYTASSREFCRIQTCRRHRFRDI